jgi:hypothetical protein
MPKKLLARAGTPDSRQVSAPKHRSIACVDLILTAALALSTAVAVTAVSIGIARADVIGAVTNGDATPLAIALSFGLLLAAMSALTAIMAGGPRSE